MSIVTTILEMMQLWANAGRRGPVELTVSREDLLAIAAEAERFGRLSEVPFAFDPAKPTIALDGPGGEWVFRTDDPPLNWRPTRLEDLAGLNSVARGEDE